MSYLTDYVIGTEAEKEDQLNNLVVFSTSEDPSTYKEALKSEILRKAMDLEI